MMFLNIAFPAGSALSVAQFAISGLAAAARPLLGLGILATMLLVFRPILSGLLRATWLSIFPKLSREERAARRTLRTAMTLNRIARDTDACSPAMAAELRAMAGRA